MADQKRRLAAILSADVVGYFRLMGDDEEATIEVLVNFRDVFSKRFENFDGRVVDTAGDSVLSVFDSVVEAVRCAMEIQLALSERNEALSDDHREGGRPGSPTSTIASPAGKVSTREAAARRVRSCASSSLKSGTLARSSSGEDIERR